MHALDKLKSQIDAKQSHVIIGLDPDKSWPGLISKGGETDERFLYDYSVNSIMEARDEIVGVKPNIAYWTALGAENVLALVFQFMAKETPELVSILDGKYGDIFKTQERNAVTNFKRYKSDMTTINSYMGTDATVKPFLSPAKNDADIPGFAEWKENHVGIIVAASSNPDAAQLQDKCDFEDKLPVYVHTAINAKFCVPTRTMAVFGATQPDKAEYFRAIENLRMHERKLWFLCPGFGPEQAGDVNKFVAIAGFEAVYPISSGIMTPSYRNGMSVAQAAASYKNQINQALKGR